MSGATILVVDKNPRFLEKTAEILGEAGHKMIAASDGHAARLKLSGQLDGALLNAALPGLSGFAVCRLAKERDPTLPVVLMFSAEDESGEVEAARAGADNWLVRPLKRHELLYVVRDMLAKRLLRRHEHDLSSADETLGGKSRLIHFELFKRLLGIELKRAQRYGFPLTILLASVDQPRTVGRDLLAQAARAAIRDIDIPVAFGQSDVLVVMPHTDGEGGRLVAERLRRRVRAEGSTSSIGIVAVEGGNRVTFATLLATVKRAQQKAAKNGGDRVEIAE